MRSDADARLTALHRRRPQALAQLMEEEIAAEELQPGTRLGTKADIQTRFGVASTTVNEAIRVMEHRGVVHVKPGPGGGVFVAQRSGWLALSGLVLDFKNSVTTAAEVLEVRDAIEGLIAADAAQHHRRGDIADLRRLVKVMRRHAGEPSAYLRANWELHRRAARLCENDFARGLYEGLLDFAEAELADVQGDAGFDARTNLAVHEELVEAIASRDLVRVAAAVEEHGAQSRAQRMIVADG